MEYTAQQRVILGLTGGCRCLISVGDYRGTFWSYNHKKAHPILIINRKMGGDIEGFFKYPF